MENMLPSNHLECNNYKVQLQRIFWCCFTRNLWCKILLHLCWLVWSIWKHQWQQCPEKFWNALFSHLHGNKSFSLKLWLMGPYPGSLNDSENIQLPTFQGKGYNQKCFWNFCITLGDIQKTNMCLHRNCSVNHWVMCLSSLATICKHRLIYCFVSWMLKVWWNN